MIESFADKRTAAVFQGLEVRGLPQEIQGAARRKLKIIDTAPSIESLRAPPGNRLERRICFRWKDGIALNVEIVDYH